MFLTEPHSIDSNLTYTTHMWNFQSSIPKSTWKKNKPRTYLLYIYVTCISKLCSCCTTSRLGAGQKCTRVIGWVEHIHLQVRSLRNIRVRGRVGSGRVETRSEYSCTSSIYDHYFLNILYPKIEKERWMYVCMSVYIHICM